MSVQQKFSIRDLRIEKLTKAHAPLIECLESYEPELKNFIIEDALHNQEKKISATYVWFDRSTHSLVGYITLLTDKINLDSSLKEEFKTQGVRYKELPALKIGRLCVDDSYQKKGIGTLMIQFAMIMAEELNERVGCRFLTLDAKRNQDSRKDAIHFYKKLGFTELVSNGKKGNTTPLYRDLTKIFEYTKLP